MALDPAPLTWLESLSSNSIDSWERLKKVFIDNFQGAIAHAGTHHDLATSGNQRLPAGIDARSAEAARVMRRSKGFVLVDSKLYRRGARSGVLMKCVTKEDGYDILREIHEGVCGNHAASRTLVGRA
jgi:hypothetical protein